MALTIGVDVGGTKVAAGVVDKGGQILEKVRRPTPSTNPQETAETIAEVRAAVAGAGRQVLLGVTTSSRNKASSVHPESAR